MMCKNPVGLRAKIKEEEEGKLSWFSKLSGLRGGGGKYEKCSRWLYRVNEE
jgi:hypothetical protein